MEEEKQHLIEELVKPEEVNKQSIPRRNSKEQLIEKILELAKQCDEPVLQSDTQLKRMNKKQLTELLTCYVEKRVEFEASKVLGLTKEQAKSSTCCNLAALKMIHQICVTSVERGVESTSGRHGMTLDGFSQRMKDSADTIDIILLEISSLYPDVISKFSSPWVRLALIWGSNAMLTLRKKSFQENAGKRRTAPVRNEQVLSI